MLHTILVTTAITRLLGTGTTEQALLTAAAAKFPELSPREFWAAAQDAMVQAERRALRPHWAIMLQYPLAGFAVLDSRVFLVALVRLAVFCVGCGPALRDQAIGQATAGATLT